MKLKEFKNNKTLVSLYVDSEGLASKKNFNNCIYSITKQKTPVDLVIFQNSLSDSEVVELVKILKDPLLTTLKVDEEGKAITEENKLEKDDSPVNYTIVKTEAKNFSELFNLGFNYAAANGYEFYLTIEQDDLFSIHWIEYAEQFASEEENNDVFLPLIRHTMNGQFHSLINEASWVEGMSEEAGITDINLLLKFNSINPLGAVFRVESIKESSEEIDGLYLPMKESMKITHSYEFFLRMIYDDLKVKTVPRVGYELQVFPKESFSEASSKIPPNLNSIPAEKGGMSQEEIQFYVDSAKKEYFFENDRKLQFKG